MSRDLECAGEKFIWTKQLVDNAIESMAAEVLGNGFNRFGSVFAKEQNRPTETRAGPSATLERISIPHVDRFTRAAVGYREIQRIGRHELSTGAIGTFVSITTIFPKNVNSRASKRRS